MAHFVDHHTVDFGDYIGGHKDRRCQACEDSLRHHQSVEADDRKDHEIALTVAISQRASNEEDARSARRHDHGLRWLMRDDESNDDYMRFMIAIRLFI
jgi:hypothetical protein